MMRRLIALALAGLFALAPAASAPAQQISPPPPQAVLYTWTPLIDFPTTGDLSVAYGAQTAAHTWQFKGPNGINFCIAAFNFNTTTFNFTTSSGTLVLKGLVPAPVSGTAQFNNVIDTIGMTGASSGPVWGVISSTFPTQVRFHYGNGASTLTTATNASVTSGTQLIMSGQIPYVC